MDIKHIFKRVGRLFVFCLLYDDGSFVFHFFELSAKRGEINFKEMSVGRTVRCNQPAVMLRNFSADEMAEIVDCCGGIENAIPLSDKHEKARLLRELYGIASGSKEDNLADKDRESRFEDVFNRCVEQVAGDFCLDMQDELTPPMLDAAEAGVYMWLLDD